METEFKKLQTSIRSHTCGELVKDKIGEKVSLIGWVNRKRDHGGLTFIDLRDRYGITQIVIHPEKKEVMKIVPEIKHEFVISVSGVVKNRPPDMVNPDLETGEIEVEAEEISIVNPSLTPPFVIEEDVKAQEELKLKYRYLDLRRRVMLHHIITRHKVIQSLRSFLSGRGFLEIETPILAKATPEGARDFLVPSSEEKGKFYALAQSPQLYKQILMVAGVDRYYQFARCLRDEDMRGDRQPEHTQIDIEMSFIDEEDIYSLTENMFRKLFKDTLGIEISIPFQRITYKDAIQKYGTDKPDTRIPLEISNLTETAKKGRFNIFNSSKVVKGIKIKKIFSRTEINELEKVVKKAGARGLLWISKQQNYRSPFVKHFDDPSIFQLKDGETLLLIAGKEKITSFALGVLRNEIGKPFIKENDYHFLWVTHFPLFEWDQETESWNPCHHIFTMPVEENFDKIDSDPGSITGRQYDTVLNGVEIASGSIRNHKYDIQKKLLKKIGLSDEEINNRFGFLLRALRYGAPPHGGIAPGIDRICMLLEGTDTIRDVIPFPKSLTKKGLLEETPSPVDEQQLKNLNIEVIKDEEKG
jgi:aspartyl-tRNA synthetase